MKGLIKKIAIFTVCLLVVFQLAFFGSVAAGGGTGDYVDIKGHWAEATIKDMVSKGWIKGISIDGHIRIQPDKDITRAEFIAVLHRTGKVPASGKEAKKFSDVSNGDWFTEALDSLSAAGLINGYEDGTFRPDIPITRAEIATILCRAAGWESPDNIKKISSMKAFSDVTEDKWYYNSVMINKLKGVINGYPDGTFGAMNKATRAEAFTMIYRYVGQLNETEPNEDSGDGETGGGDSRDDKNNTDEETKTGAGKISDSVGFISYDVTGKEGERVLFQVYGYGMKNLGRFEVKLSYNPDKVVAEAVVKGTIMQDYYLSADLSAAEQGYITIRGNGEPSADDTGRGIVFVVMFRAKAAGKTAVAISGPNAASPELYTVEGKLFENVTVEKGSITVK